MTIYARRRRGTMEATNEQYRGTNMSVIAPFAGTGWRLIKRNMKMRRMMASKGILNLNK